MGYDAVTAYSQYRITDKEGFSCIIFSFSNSVDLETMEIHVGRRLNIVEAFAQKYLRHFSDFNAHSMTLVASEARISGSKVKRYDVSDGLSISDRDHIEEFVRGNGEDLIEQWSNLSGLNKTYNADPGDMELFYNVFNKAMRGCIISKFLGDPAYISIRDAYMSLLKKHGVPDVNIEAFIRVNGILHHYNPN